MRISLSVVLFGAIIMLAGCKKDSACLFNFVISNNYTETDPNGTVMNTPNPDDWTYDHKWNACENSLFDFADTCNYQGLTATTINNVIGFPNPFKNEMVFSAEETGSLVAKVVLVDDQMDILHQYTLSNPYAQVNGLTEAFNFSGLHSKRHYRLYYRFYGNNKTVIYQGHGDLRTTQ